MKENKYNLFYDYSNTSNIEENEKRTKKYSFLSTYYYYPTAYNTNIKNINIDSISFNERIKERKESFNKICNSINKILSRYKDNKIKLVKTSIKENNNLNVKNVNLNLNRIAEHLINTFSKEELKLIKEKINKKVEEEEPKPEKFFYNNNYINVSNAKLNKNKILNKPIKLEIDKISNYKKINNKNKRNNVNIIRRNINNDYQLNSTFLTYIKCKTSLECLDNYLKRLRKKRNNKEVGKLNIKSKTPNISTNTSSKYLIKTRKIKKEKEEKKENNKIKYINHKYDYIKSLYKNDKFLLKRIKEQNNKKLKKYEKIKKEQNNEKLEQCTFKPNISKTSLKNILSNKKFNFNKNTQTETSYLDFYQYKKNQKKRLNSKKGKSQKNNKQFLIQIPKNLNRTKSDKKKRNSNNKNFLEFHQLIIQKSLNE